jgi:hypothetical protein
MPRHAHVSGALGMKHLVAQFGLSLTSTCLGLGLIYLVYRKVVAMHT